MAHFLAYYWMKQSDRAQGMLCERLDATDYEDALAQVNRRLDQTRFTFVSENMGRVLVVSAHVQYVELENNDSESELADLMGLPAGFSEEL